MRPATPQHPRVSVVDDDESVRESLPDLLRELGFDVMAFASGREFLASEVARTECLILDVTMPGMTGPEVQSELSRLGHTIPIIFMTAETEEAARIDALKQGAAGYLLKPFSEAALLGAVNAALGLKP